MEKLAALLWGVRSANHLLLSNFSGSISAIEGCIAPWLSWNTPWPVSKLGLDRKVQATSRKSGGQQLPIPLAKALSKLHYSLVLCPVLLPEASQRLIPNREHAPQTSSQHLFTENLTHARHLNQMISQSPYAKVNVTSKLPDVQEWRPHVNIHFIWTTKHKFSMQLPKIKFIQREREIFLYFLKISCFYEILFESHKTKKYV